MMFFRHGIGPRTGISRASALALALSVAPLLFSSGALAQDAGPSAPDPMGTTFTITEAVIAGGGVTTSQSPCFELAGTTAQAVAGPASGDTYEVYAGFWDDSGSSDTLFRNGFEACQP
ncbi:hypothetical protein [Dokdonella sp.]|uniref:hypothetical protein n=1 Tax=Dokdonella sp. TaxID=2291710 RepID=UPI00352706DF